MKIRKFLFTAILIMLFSACDDLTKIPEKHIDKEDANQGNINLITEVSLKQQADKLYKPSGIPVLRASDVAMQLKTKVNEKEKRIESIAYDDEEGFFTVQDSKFKKEFILKGYEHPYKSEVQSLKECEFLFDRAIKDNLKLESFLTEANNKIEDFLKLEVMLSNGKIIKLGKHSDYILSAKLEKDEDKIKVVPQFKLKFKRNGQDDLEQVYSTFVRLKDALKREYFTKEAVFAYIAKNLGDDFVKANREKFASEFYRIAKATGKTPDNLFDETLLSVYRETYKNNNGQGHYTIDDIDYAINEIDADDYEGTVELDFYVSTKHRISENNGLGKDNRKTITKQGFKQITEETAKNFFNFTIIPNNLKEKELWRSEWFNKSFTNFPFIRVKDSEKGYVIHNPLPREKRNGSGENTFYLSVNSSIPEEFFPSDNPLCLAGTNSSSNTKIFVENIAVEKKKGVPEIRFRCRFKGKNPRDIIIESKPFLGYEK